MKTILCYGDSNTWGFMPTPGGPQFTANNRFPWGVRWTSRMQIALGHDYHVAECGVNGRTTLFDCPMAEYRNGLKDIDVCMQSQHPVDMVIIMLGTNDTKMIFNANAYIIAKGVGRIIDRIRQGAYGPNGACPEILVVSPIHIHANMMNEWLKDEFGAHALEVDAQLSEKMAKMAHSHGVHFMDAGEWITADPGDGIHMNADGHALLAEKMTAKVKEILG